MANFAKARHVFVDTSVTVVVQTVAQRVVARVAFAFTVNAPRRFTNHHAVCTRRTCRRTRLANGRNVVVDDVVAVVVQAVAGFRNLTRLNQLTADDRAFDTFGFADCATAESTVNVARQTRIGREVVDDAIAVIVLVIAKLRGARVGIAIVVVAVTSQTACANTVSVTVTVEAVARGDAGANVVTARGVDRHTFPRVIDAVCVRRAATATDAFANAGAERNAERGFTIRSDVTDVAKSAVAGDHDRPLALGASVTRFTDRDIRSLTFRARVVDSARRVRLTLRAGIAGLANV